MSQGRIYFRETALRRDDPGACEVCGIYPCLGQETIVESGLRREDLPGWVAEHLDTFRYASEDCPGCARTLVIYGRVEGGDPC
jgi:hypothetical protein